MSERSEDYIPLSGIYGSTATEIIKETIGAPKKETKCVGLKFFGSITPGEDRSLIEDCAAVSYWCCCETKRIANNS